MNDSENREVQTSDAKPNGGLYSKINMSVRTANILVAVVLVLLVGAGVFVIRHNGFTVSFETDGGSAVRKRKGHAFRAYRTERGSHEGRVGIYRVVLRSRLHSEMGSRKRYSDGKHDTVCRMAEKRIVYVGSPGPPQKMKYTYQCGICFVRRSFFRKKRALVDFPAVR